ncbi:MAG: hypothetical protein U0235_12120 [Polyangiaceae bacterium]
MSEFVALVEPELARAKAAIAGGVSPAGVYEALTKDGVPPAAPEEKTVSVVKGAPLLGRRSAAVTVHVFSDFQCPFCSRVDRRSPISARSTAPRSASRGTTSRCRSRARASRSGSGGGGAGPEGRRCVLEDA